MHINNLSSASKSHSDLVDAGVNSSGYEFSSLASCYQKHITKIKNLPSPYLLDFFAKHKESSIPPAGGGRWYDKWKEEAPSRDAFIGPRTLSQERNVRLSKLSTWHSEHFHKVASLPQEHLGASLKRQLAGSSVEFPVNLMKYLERSSDHHSVTRIRADFKALPDEEKQKKMAMIHFTNEEISVLPHRLNHDSSLYVDDNKYKDIFSGPKLFRGAKISPSVTGQRIFAPEDSNPIVRVGGIIKSVNITSATTSPAVATEFTSRAARLAPGDFDPATYLFVINPLSDHEGGAYTTGALVGPLAPEPQAEITYPTDAYFVLRKVETAGSGTFVFIDEVEKDSALKLIENGANLHNMDNGELLGKEEINKENEYKNHAKKIDKDKVSTLKDEVKAYQRWQALV